jgi:hypothetical protein
MLRVEPVPLSFAPLAFLIAGFVMGVIGVGLPDRLHRSAQPRHAAGQSRFAPDRAFVRHQRLAASGPSFRRLAHRFWPTLAGMVLGTLAGTGLLTGKRWSGSGFCWCSTRGLGLTPVRFSAPPASEWWLGPLIGALAGLATASTGVVRYPRRALPRRAGLGF